MSAHSIKPATLAHGVGPLLIVVLVLSFAQWTGHAQSSSAAAAWVLIHSIGLPLLWLASAIGLGLPLRAVLFRDSRDGAALQTALGIAAMMWLDESFGLLGLLQRGGGVGAWALIVIGIALLAIQLINAWKMNADAYMPPWLIWTASPAIAVLLLASCSAPGWLWSSEFGGYDALSYHLQLPKEWFALGRIEPLQHNVYSFFPGYVEAAYYHLMVLRGDAIDAVYACQVLHADLTLLAAALIGCVARRMVSDVLAAVIAGVLALGTPWVIVVGSLAYNEMAVVLMLAAGLLALMDESLTAGRRGWLIGVFSATACAAKLTALGMAAVPLGVLMLLVIRRPEWMKTIVGALAAGTIVLAPSLLRNWAFSGNALFPFATGVLGAGQWTAEQVSAFARGHSSNAPLTARPAELWNQFLRYGIGSNPDAREPWKPQWAILPWLGTLGLVLGLTSRSMRAWSIRLLVLLLIQIGFWMCFTHLKSRFMLPLLVPLSIGTAIGASILLNAWAKSPMRRMASNVMAAAFLLAWSCVPVWLFRSERDGGPAAGVDMVRYFAGEDVSAPEREDLAATFPMVAINHVLPAGARVLMIGDATPLYVRDQSRIAYQTTWDRGPLSRIMREHPDDPAAWEIALRQQEFVFVLINPDMLDVWERAGWNDPLITAPRVMQLAKPPARIVRQFPNGEVLVRLD